MNDGTRFGRKLEHLDKFEPGALPERAAARDAAIYVNDTIEVAYAIAVDIFLQASPEAVLMIYDRINAEKLRRESVAGTAEEA